MTQFEYIALLFADCGFDTRAQREGFMTREFGRAVKFSDELQPHERSRLIDILKDLKAGQQDQARAKWSLPEYWEWSLPKHWEIIQMTLELKGHIPSKANCYRRNAKSGMRISVAAKAQLDALGFQINAQWHGKTPLVHPEIRVTFRFANAAQDRDNALKSLLDLLQTCGVIENDNVRKFNGTVVIEPAVITLPTREGVTVDITEAART